MNDQTLATGRNRPELVVILAGVCAALHVAKLSPALPVLRESLGVTLLQAGFLLSLVQLAGMLLGLGVGLVADGIGLKRSMLAGLLVLSLASAAGGWAPDPATLLAWRAVEGLGFLLVCMPAPALIRRLVAPAHMKTTLGWWGAYMPFGTAVALLLGPMVLGTTSWQNWWLLLAGLSAIMAAWLWRAVPQDRVYAYAHGLGATTRIDGAWLSRLRRTVSSRGPWLVAMAFALYSGQWLAVIGFLPSVVAHDGAVGLAMAAPLALAAMVNTVGNIASGRLLQRGVPAHRLLYVGYCAMGIGALVAFASFPGLQGSAVATGLRYSGVLLFSMVGGLIPGTLFSLAVVLAPDEASVSTTVGWMQQWSAMGQFTGPPLVALVAGIVGGWQWTWLITGTCSILGLLVASQVARPMVR